MKPVITTRNNAIVVGGFFCAAGSVPETSLDMTPYAGEHVHIWLDDTGEISMDSSHDHYWHICEITVPARVATETADPEHEGATIVTQSPVDLADAVITSYDLPGDAL